jgi:hypothetical protein
MYHLEGKGIGKKYMSRKPAALAILIVLLGSGSLAWPMGQKMDIFVPIDALVAEKRYPEAIDMLRSLLVSAPRRTSAIKERIANTLLQQAEEEFKNQRYNESLSALSLFWAQNPDRADQAQKIIRMINKVREAYNRLAKELLAYMSDAANRLDPDYNREVTRRLQELDDLDRNNPDSKRTLTSLKETSLALVNQDSMKAVMSEARALLDGNGYAKALRAYLKGFPLFRPEFENAGYDELTVQAIASEARKAAALPDAYEAAQAAWDRSVADLGAALGSGDPARVEAAFPAAKASLDQLRGFKEALFAAGTFFSRSYASIPKADKSPIEYQYLAYLDIFLRGRPDSFGPDKKPEEEKGKSEGMGGVLLAQTDELLTNLGNVAQASVDAAYSAAEKAYDAGAYAEARAAFARSSALVAQAIQVLDNWTLLSEGDFVPDLAALKANIRKAAADSGRVSNLSTLASAGGRLSVLAAGFVATASAEATYRSRLTAAVPLADARAAMDAFRASIRASEASIGEEAAGEAGLAAAAAATAAALGDNRPVAALASYGARLQKAAAAALAAEYAVAAATGGVEGDYLERELAARAVALDAADALTAGLPSMRPERSLAGYLDPSPTNALLALAAERPKLAAVAAWIAGVLESMGKESAGLVADPSFAAARARIADLGRKAAALQERSAEALAKAAEKKKAAETALAGARQDMDAAKARLADAKALIALDKAKGLKAAAIMKDFADSRERLDRGLKGVVASTNLDFAARTWDDFQLLYSGLSADLNQTRKDYIINETFRLLGEGQTYYDQSLFDLAAESLNGAQELWREDNDSDQEQVKYWQNLVRQASDTNNKREVKQSDTQFYEIGSFLSEARRFFLRGDGLIKAGRKAEAAAAFESSRQNLSYVTRTFPLNAEAGLLTLQILKSTDVETYRKSLPRRIQEAVELLAADPSSGYSRIADLYRMEPAYPGLKAALENAEIMVGKRRAPPTKEQLARASALVADAEKLLKTGRKDDAAKAETELNAALAVDPTNKQALSNLRDLKTLQGKTAGPSLGLADQAILDQATRSFAAQQYNAARDQLSKLLSDPGKRTRDVLKLDNDLKTLGYN